jgi:glycosyltransferase involved in cell wall biosynthesis
VRVRIVIVTHFFPPDGGPGVVRPHALATELAARGHDVTVITATAEPAEAPFTVISVPYQRIRARLRALRAGSHRPPAASSTPAPGTGPGARASGAAPVAPSPLVSLLARIAERTVQHPDKYSGWIRAVDAWWRYAGAKIDRPDVVLATTPPVSAAMVGSLLAKRWGCPLVLDFRDLWTESPYYRFGPLRRAIDHRAEKRLVAGAGAITVVTDELARVARSQYPGRAFTLVRTGAPVRTAAVGDPSRDASQPMTIGHFGSMDDWVRRDASPVVRAAESLARDGNVPAGAVLLEFFGPAGEAFRASVAGAVERGLVSVRGTVSHDQAAAELDACDVALLLMWPEDSHSMPMKATEYLAAGKTVLVLGAGADSEVRRVLGGVEGVYFCDDDAATREALALCWERFHAGGAMDWADPERARPFLAPAMADGFERVLDATVRASDEGCA